MTARLAWDEVAFQHFSHQGLSDLVLVPLKGGDEGRDNAATSSGTRRDEIGTRDEVRVNG